jgi:hypothetical protein
MSKNEKPKRFSKNSHQIRICHWNAAEMNILCKIYVTIKNNIFVKKYLGTFILSFYDSK